MSISAASRAPPDGWEVVVSTAHTHRIEGTPRAAFLAELVAAQPSIVVGGAHGKTTTAAMIAYVLQETGRDPAWIIGGLVPQLGGNAGHGRRLARRRGRRVRPLDRLPGTADRGRHQHRARPPRVVRIRGRARGVLRSLARRASRTSSASWDLDPVELELSVPGDHNRQNAAAALAALELAGVPRADAEAAIVRFTGVGRRFELVGDARRRDGRTTTTGTTRPSSR